jgi:DNA polymerase-4/DNA polymerase V
VNKKSKNNKNNLFLHVDGDAFFVACELTEHPELRGKPVIVGGDRGIAVAMSSEAKKLGVTRGMPVFRIKKDFPEVIILSHHFDLYADIAKRLHQILESYFQTIEVYSIDECFALVETSEIKYFGNEKKLLTELKNEIEKTLGVTYSIGLARTKALAKQASKLEKPNGLVMLLSRADEVRALKATPIDDIWGIGRQTVPALRLLKMNNAYDFVNYFQ